MINIYAIYDMYCLLTISYNVKDIRCLKKEQYKVYVEKKLKLLIFCMAH